MLLVVECLKEFKGMLWGQKIRVYTDHKNLEVDTLSMTLDHVYCWRLVLEEYGPEIIYIKGNTNIAADPHGRSFYSLLLWVATTPLHLQLLHKMPYPMWI